MLDSFVEGKVLACGQFITSTSNFSHWGKERTLSMKVSLARLACRDLFGLCQYLVTVYMRVEHDDGQKN